MTSATSPGPEGTPMDPDDRELTPWERELQQEGASQGRGHTPDEDRKSVV